MKENTLTNYKKRSVFALTIQNQLFIALLYNRSVSGPHPYLGSGRDPSPGVRRVIITKFVGSKECRACNKIYSYILFQFAVTRSFPPRRLFYHAAAHCAEIYASLSVNYDTFMVKYKLFFRGYIRRLRIILNLRCFCGFKIRASLAKIRAFVRREFIGACVQINYGNFLKGGV